MEIESSDAIITDAPIVERERTHLNAEEHALLKELLRPGVLIGAVIPEDADPEEVWKTLDACVRGLGLLEARSLRVKYIVGKILLMFEEKPSLYKTLGYDTYSDFMQRGVYDTLGLGRTSAYEAKLAAGWKQLTPDRYARIGPKKMNVIAKVTTPTSPNAEAWLEKAETMKGKELVQYAEQRGILSRGETEGATLIVHTNRDRLALFNAFFNDPRVQSVVGSKDRDRIIEAMIPEVYDEWISRAEEERASKFREAYA